MSKGSPWGLLFYVHLNKFTVTVTVSRQTESPATEADSAASKELEIHVQLKPISKPITSFLGYLSTTGVTQTGPPRRAARPTGSFTFAGVHAILF